MRANTVEPGLSGPGFVIQSSNSLPMLLDRMAGVLREDPLPPLEWERIVVQSGGMRRWVTLELAKELGVAASISMPFPRNCAAWLARKLNTGGEDRSPSSPDSNQAGPGAGQSDAGARTAGDSAGGAAHDALQADPFGRQQLTWRLMALLGGDLTGDDFAPIRAYLADNDMRKRYQLAAKIAGTFDEYQLYRTELLRDWELEDRDAETFKHLGWQSRLWRCLCAGLEGQQHLGSSFRDLIDHVKKLDGPVEEIDGMPRRLMIFGVSSLPPIFIELLAALGRHIPVTVYRFSPTRVKRGSGEEGEGNRKEKSGSQGATAAKGGSRLEGNRLLGSMGEQGDVFLELLLKHGAVEGDGVEQEGEVRQEGETERKAGGAKREEVEGKAERKAVGADKTEAGSETEETEVNEVAKREGLWVVGGDGSGEGVRTCLQVIQNDILDDVDRGGFGGTGAGVVAGSGGEAEERGRSSASGGASKTAGSECEGDEPSEPVSGGGRPESGAPSRRAPALPLNPNDRSLSVHNCHSPLREMEVLRNLLLEAFDSTPDLKPSDILVMVPEIASYAPYVDAVFGVRHDDTPHIPYRIADRKRGEEQPLSEGVLKVLTLADARLTATEVIDLLEIPSVRRKAGILGRELPQIRHWVQDTNIRWGVDGAFKKDVFDLPPFEANTWRAGLDRLLMGMITGPRDDLVAGVLPLGTATMSHLDLLGRFDCWVTDLFQRLESMRSPRSLTDWADLLGDMLENFFAPEGDEEQALQSVREELNRMRRAGEAGGDEDQTLQPGWDEQGKRGGASNADGGTPDQPSLAGEADGGALRRVGGAEADEEQAQLFERDEQSSGRGVGTPAGGAHKLELDVTVIRDHLEQTLGEEGRTTSFISGAVTFCALKPMRTIPFRVIAVAGLDDGSFPSKERPPTFDLMAAKPLPGDRSVRADQKQLFLETLAAAKDRLIITYVGRSQKDNKERAASVVVDELLNVVDQSFILNGDSHLLNGSSHRSSSALKNGDSHLFSCASSKKRSNLSSSPRDAITTLHPLQPFNTAYFDRSDPKLISYSRENCLAAEGVRTTRAAQDPPSALPFFTETIPLSEENAQCLNLTLDELIACWINSCKFFCNKTLGIVLPREEAELEDVEPLEMAGLEKYAFENWLARERLGLAVGHATGEPLPQPDLEREWRILQARGDLPPGQLGRALHAQLGTQVQQFVEQVGALKMLEPLTVDLEGKGWKLTGRIESLTDQGRVQFRCASLKPKDIIRAWVTHVVLNADTPSQTRLVSTDPDWVFRKLDDADAVLEELLTGCREALQRPVPFFEKTSFAYFNSLQKIKNYEETGKGRKPPPLLKAAYGQWQGDQFHGGADSGERDDPYIALCFRGKEPLVENKKEFEERAVGFWGRVDENTS